VQGVGFRWFVRERAHALRLAGWVRNLDDGSVEIAAQGEPSAIDALVAAAGEGPRGARVAQVPALSLPASTEYPTPFAVRS
jgi:acylphosphatase